MAEPKKETVRIALPPTPETTLDPPSGGAKRDTARILLPSRTPAIPPRRLPPTINQTVTPVGVEPAAESPVIPLHRPPVQPPSSSASPLLQPLPKPAAPAPDSSATEVAAPENFGEASVRPGPKKETARITSLPKPAGPPKPAGNMTKTQTLVMRPAAIVPASPVVVATSSALDAFDSIPRSLCWGLLGLSALIFFIQIWNYAVS
jgi:hypothetical protein